jgi:hypothetical protein
MAFCLVFVLKIGFAGEKPNSVQFIVETAMPRKEQREI